jgi:hypothetical protein
LAFVAKTIYRGRVDEGALGAGAPNGLAEEPSGLEVAPDGPLGDIQGIGSLSHREGFSVRRHDLLFAAGRPTPVMPTTLT